jgi:hypothetical protein
MEKFVSDNAMELARVKALVSGIQSPNISIDPAIDLNFAMVASWMTMLRLGSKGVELTEASLPVAETAATERLDCRKAFLNIVYEVQREVRLFSLKERCNWGRGWLEVEIADGRRRALSTGRRLPARS